MKIIIILATGTLLTFSTVDNKVYDPNPDCFTQGYSIMEKISVYRGPEEVGKNQGWVLNDSNIQLAGWYCK